MNKEDITRLAREAGVVDEFHGVFPSIQRFAILVAHHEREACAKVALTGTGEAVQLKTLETIRAERERIANAIRNRSN